MQRIGHPGGMVVGYDPDEPNGHDPGEADRHGPGREVASDFRHQDDHEFDRRDHHRNRGRCRGPDHREESPHDQYGGM